MNSFWFSVLLPPTTKLRQSNVFAHVCDSVHRGVSVQGSLSPGGLCPGPRGPLSRSRGSLSRSRGVSVQGSLCLGALCPGRSLSRGISVQVYRGLCAGPGGSLCRSRGVSVQVQGGLCPVGSMFRKFSVQGRLCPVESLSRGVSVQGSLCQGDPPYGYGYMWVVRILLECN